MEKKYQDAATAYQNSHVKNMSGFEIVVELYKGMIKNIEHAKESYTSGQLDVMSNHIQKTNRILVALQSHLDFEQGGEASLFLNQFYNGVFVSLTKILSNPNPEESFDQILEHVRHVYSIWHTHAYGDVDTTKDVTGQQDTVGA